MQHGKAGITQDGGEVPIREPLPDSEILASPTPISSERLSAANNGGDRSKVVGRTTGILEKKGKGKRKGTVRLQEIPLSLTKEDRPGQPRRGKNGPIQTG